MASDDVWSLLQLRRRRAAGLPVVTGFDGTARSELSATSLENAAAKIANALRDEFDLGAGSVVGIDLPLHWQRATWCAGVWAAGCVLAPGAVDADLVVAGVDRAPALIARGAPEVQAVSLHPFGLPTADPLPPGVVDVTLAVRQQPDAYLYDPPRADLPALRVDDRDLSQAAMLEQARDLARAWGLEPQGRLLVGPGVVSTPGWLAALAVPLAVEASVVLAADGDPDGRIAQQEHVTATAT